MSRWYYEFNEEQLGPISQAELIHFINSEALTKDTWVWKKDMEEWQQIEFIPELNQHLPPKVPLLKRMAQKLKKDSR